jgi:hypothetical protein
MMMNKYQSVFTEKDFENLPKDVKLDFITTLDTVPFVKWLIEPENIRGFAKDKVRWDNPNNIKKRKEDPKGKISVDITKPHILEDMDFFRERAIFFNKYGRYTNLVPNPNPKSEYARFWKEELRRWKHGITRPSDGEWIPGGLYFYWNYCPIWIVEKTEEADGEGERTREFPHPWLGDYLFYHYMEQARNNGKHVKMLKTRGIGASFKMGSLSPRNMYIHPGSGNPNFHLASDKTFLQGDKGVFGKVMDTLDWIATHTPLPKLRLGDSKRAMEIQLGYQDSYGVRKGLLSSVFGISMKDNSDKARGIRGPLIHYEEDGVFPNLESTWNINRRAVEEGKVAYGQMVALGTGGVEGGNFAGSERLFYNPNAYNIYGIPNVFDKNSNGKTECGFFWGAYLSRNDCYDKDTGEPDVTKALLEILIERAKTRASASDSKTITQNMAEEPITPQEAVMRIEGTVFPVADLKEHLSSISVDMGSFTSSHYVGELVLGNNGEVDFRNRMDLYPVREYPALDNKKGAIEIFELPQKVRDNYRYIVGVDVYDDDLVEFSSSLGSAFVFDRWTRRIVAEFTGRPGPANDFYEICYRLARFYNASIMYENNKKGMFTYFNTKGILLILADTPEILVDKQLTKAKTLTGNVSKGVNATAAVNSYGLRLQADWMLESAYIEDGKELKEGEVPEYVPNISKIRSIGYLKEAIAWHPKLNADRVSAMNMVMIYDAELSQYELGRGGSKKNTRASDPFFDKIYKTSNVAESFGYKQQNYFFPTN